MNRNGLYDYFRKLDRSIFIGNEFKDMSSIDAPLPIGYGQTISQPSLVLEMTYLLQPDKKCKILEIGTGSGYQTAFLAHYAARVYTIEKVPELSATAKERLKVLGFDNITFKIGDGSEGWKEYAPFERIIITAAAGMLPDEIMNQLKNGGRMIAPVGGKGLQDLLLITKDKKGSIGFKTITKVRFVEMKGKYGWTKE